MSVVKVKPSVVIDVQAPEFIRSDYAKFITFLQAYYAYLEQNNKALDVTRYLDVYNDIDEQTEDQILGVMYSLFLPDFPQILKADKKFILKHVAEFYSSRGSIESIKAFFRIAYGEEVEVYLPKVDMLKLNAGVWRKFFKIKINSISSGTIYNLLGQEIYQVDSITGNKTVIARIVDYDQTTGSVIITADNIILNFDSALPVYSTRNDTGADVTFYLTNQLATETISYGGLNYSIGDTVVLDNGVKNTENIVIDKVTYGKVTGLVLKTAGDNYSTSDEISFDDVYSFDGSNATFVNTTDDTLNLSSHSLSLGDIVTYRVEPDTTYANEVIGGLSENTTYYAIPVDTAKIKLATTLDNAKNGICVDLVGLGYGTKHSIVYSIPNSISAKAKITRVASEDMLMEGTDSLADILTFAEEEDRITLEDGETIRGEVGEQAVFKYLATSKYVTDVDINNVNAGSLTSDEFGFLLETQGNDSVTYTKSSYIKSNGLIRSLLPSTSDASNNFNMNWANNRGIQVTLQDEELRVGFAYDDSYAASGSVTPQYPMTFVIEFQSNEDYNNLDFYELSRNWGTTNVPTVQAITNWDFYSAAEYEDLCEFSELQHLGIYPEGVTTLSAGEASISQRGFDPVNKPILVIREVGAAPDSSITSTQRPWEYRFVFKQNSKATVKLFVNPQPIKAANQQFKMEATTGDQTIINEDGSFLQKEVYSGYDIYTVEPSASAPATSILVRDLNGNAITASTVFNKYDKVRIENPSTNTYDGVVSLAPVSNGIDRTNNAIHRETIVVNAANASTAIISLNDEVNTVTINDNVYSGGTTTTNTITGAASGVPWAGISSNGLGQLVVVQKSGQTVFGAAQAYTPTNEVYYTTLATPTSSPTWTNGKLPSLGVWGHMEYGRDRYVVLEGSGNPLLEPVIDFVTGSRACYSTDGINWNITTLPVGDCWTKLKYVNGKFWALPYGATSLADMPGNTSGSALDNEIITLTAPAGATFTRVLFASYGTPTGVPGSYAINPAQHAQNSVDVVAATFIGKNTATIRVNTQTFGVDPAPGVTKRLYITLEYSYKRTSTALVTQDGMLWDKVTMPFTKVSDIAYGNGVYVATSFRNTSEYAYSTDGVNWSLGRLPLNDTDLNNYQPTGNAFWACVTFNLDKFIAAPANDPSNNTNARLQDRIAVSYDGITWSLHSSAAFTSSLAASAGSKGYVTQIIYTPTQKFFHFIAQGVTFTPTIATSTYNIDGVAYMGGGLATDGVTNIAEVDAFNMTAQTSSNPAVTLAASRYFPTPMSSNNIGFYFGGWVNAVGASGEIDGIRYSDQTLINPAASTPVAGGHNAGGNATDYSSRGYQLGGYSGTSTSAIQKFTYDTWVATNLAATLSQQRYGGANVHSLVTNKSYCLGGYNVSTTTYTTEIDGIDMTSDTAINPSSVLSVGRVYIAGVSSRNTQKAYALGGSDAGNYNRIDALDFSTETSYLSSATLSVARSWATGAQDFTNGFAIGGTGFSEIDGLAFATETSINPAATLAVSRYYTAATSQYPSTTAYSSTSYYSKSIQGTATGGAIYNSGEQLTAGKEYYVSAVSGNEISVAFTKEDALNGYSIKVDAKAGVANIRLLTDRIYAGDQDSFNRTTKDAQLTIYAKKRSVGSRDHGIRYNRNPNVPIFDDVERENLNYTSDNKYYVHESINEFQDYIILEKNDQFSNDQVNLELEIDKRSDVERDGYVTYPYLATEGSTFTVVKHNDDIDIPNYSKVRLFVDRDVLQSANNTNRQSSRRIYNDYANLNADHDSVHMNTDVQIYSGLSNPVISSTPTLDTYRGNFNYTANGYEEIPYVTGVIPEANLYSSGPAAFGNTGVNSFVNNDVLTLSSSFDDGQQFFKIVVSPEQKYYDNDPTKPSLQRSLYTLQFNVPKEYGEFFDTPLNVSLKNLADSSVKTKSFKPYDNNDALYLDSGDRFESVITNSYIKVPVDPYIVGSNITTSESNSTTPRAWCNGLSRQNFPAWRDAVAKNAQNSARIMISSGGGAAGSLSSWESLQNLPSYLLGLDYIDSINDSDAFTVYLTHPTTIYMLWNTAWNAVDKTGWTLVETVSTQLVSNVAGSFAIYKRDYPVTNITLDNNSALYFFKYNNVGTQTGYSFWKVSGTQNTWDGQVYGNRPMLKNCYVRFQADVPANGQNIAMVGLNPDPTADASYTSLDYSWYVADPIATGKNNILIYENGSNVAGFGYVGTRDTVLEIWYDGVTVNYILDGQVVRRVARAVGAPLYLDSSFYYVFPTSGAPLGIRNLEFGELVPKYTTVSPPPDVSTYDGVNLALEDNSGVVLPESDNNGNYSLSNPTIAIEFFSPTLAKQTAALDPTAKLSYHYIMYCDRVEYDNVSTDSQHTTYHLYNCWSPTNSNLLSNDASIKDYIITIRDLTKSDYIIKRKFDELNRQSSAAAENLFKDVWIAKDEDSYGKYVKFYSSYANAVAGTSPLTMSQVGIGKASIANVLESTTDTVVDDNAGKFAYNYYGTMYENDTLITYTFDPRNDVSANTIIIPNHSLTSGDQIKFRKTFEGYLPTGLVDRQLYFVTVIGANTIKLSTTQANRIAASFVSFSAAGAEADGKICSLQLLPRSLDFGSTQFTLNTKQRYTIAGSNLFSYTEAYERTTNLSSKQYAVVGRTDIFQLPVTANVFRDTHEFTSGDLVEITLGSGDKLQDHDDNIINGPATVYAYAAVHSDNIVSFVKDYDEAITGNAFISCYYNNFKSVFTNTTFRTAHSYVSGNVFYMQANTPHNLSIGTALNVLSTGVGLSNTTKYYVSSSNFTTTSFSITTSNDATGVTTVPSTTYNNLVTIVIDGSDSRHIHAPMITGTIKEDVVLSYTPNYGRETGTILNVDLTTGGSYNRIPTTNIITLEGRAGTGAEIYPVVDDIGTVTGVEFLDGGTHSVNRTMYLPYSFFSDSISGNWQIGETVLKTATEIGTLIDKNGRYFKIQQNGAVVTITYGDTLTGKASGATASVGRTFNISNVTQAKPAVVSSSTPHNLSTGDLIYVSGINSTVTTGYYYASVNSATTFYLYTNATLGTPVDTTATTTYTSGGTVSMGIYTATGTAIPGEITLSSANGPTTNYENDKNLLLPTTHLQNDYYQEYSYAVRSGTSVETWKPYFNKLIHPAGVAVFGEIDYNVANIGDVLLGNTTVTATNEINNTKTATSPTVTIT